MRLSFNGSKPKFVGREDDSLGEGKRQYLFNGSEKRRERNKGVSGDAQRWRNL
ncbi:MAG: hypothetical protein N2V74_01255 [Candidatus Methanospirare jalkutatii]|nr:MAG: hypothetical protein N2V74_01255 [Candidatus Methanospirare jalkutatii]